ncbi:methyl-accepting chemotaxis protein [Marinibaculum pumilum]|uniref:Methyl-accepting chemotaxis protein n=1 Tax=Marinibaculum pumilum TaxID=1766165 RepID=A0ABV7KTZ4_9PROT
MNESAYIAGATPWRLRVALVPRRDAVIGASAACAWLACGLVLPWTLTVLVIWLGVVPALLLAAFAAGGGMPSGRQPQGDAAAAPPAPEAAEPAAPLPANDAGPAAHCGHPDDLRRDVLDLEAFTGIAERQIDLVVRETEEAAGDILERVNDVEAAMRATVAYLREATGSAHVVQVIEQSESSMNRCRDELAGIAAERERDVASIAERMQEVKDLAASLEGLIGDVREISRQTNMLAINAAIEAVHSGAAGAGFAVIAREIKDLSAAVDGTAMSISRGVQELRSGVEQAFRTTVEERVEKERAIFGNVSTAMNQLTANLERLIAHQRDTIVKVCRENEEIAQPIMELAACVQFQDIARQQLIQLRNGWRTVNDHLAGVALQDPETAGHHGTLKDKIDSFYGDYVRAEQRDTHAGRQAAAPAAMIELF